MPSLGSMCATSAIKQSGEPNIGKLFQRYRLFLGLSQKSRAMLGGIGFRTIGDLERWRRDSAKDETQWMVADVLLMSPGVRMQFLSSLACGGSAGELNRRENGPGHTPYSGYGLDLRPDRLPWSRLHCER